MIGLCISMLFAKLASTCYGVVRFRSLRIRSCSVLSWSSSIYFISEVIFFYTICTRITVSVSYVIASVVNLNYLLASLYFCSSDSMHLSCFFILIWRSPSHLRRALKNSSDSFLNIILTSLCILIASSFF